MKSRIEPNFKLSGKVVIIGIGNMLRGDDGFGPRLIEKIKGKLDAVCIDAGTAPENYIGKIVKLKPDTVLIIDVAGLDLQPGEYDILKKEDILKSGFTTHDISPHMFIEFLEDQTKAEIFMLGVQPKEVSFGAGMSREVKEALDKIAELLIEKSKGDKKCTKRI